VPRALIAALVATGLLAGLGLADAIVRLAAPERRPRGIGLSAAMDAWYVIGAVYLCVGCWRRDPRARLVMFWIAIAAAIVFAVFLVPLVTMAALGQAALDAPGSMLPVLVVCFAVVAWGLSRPSARAWFEAGRGAR
jgi:hypothetical protein